MHNPNRGYPFGRLPYQSEMAHFASCKANATNCTTRSKCDFSVRKSLNGILRLVKKLYFLTCKGFQPNFSQQTLFDLDVSGHLQLDGRLKEEIFATTRLILA